MSQWEAERVVDAELARALLCEQFPELQAEKLELLGVGWDNTAYLLNDRFVFRFPRRAIAVPLLKAEAATLPRIAARLSQPVPVPKWLGKPGPRYDWPFAGYRMLPGQTACSVDLSDAERMALAAPIAEFLRGLHAITADEARSFGLAEDTLGKLDRRKRLKQIRDYLDEIEVWHTGTPAIDFRRLRELANFIEQAHLPDRADHCLVHGDFYVRHILIDDKKRLCGVIDWGDLAISEPALDLSVAYSFLPPEAHERFFAAYGDIDIARLPLARMRALNHALILARYGQATGDHAICREGLRSMHYLSRL